MLIPLASPSSSSSSSPLHSPQTSRIYRTRSIPGRLPARHLHRRVCIPIPPPSGKTSAPRAPASCSTKWKLSSVFPPCYSFLRAYSSFICQPTTTSGRSIRTHYPYPRPPVFRYFTLHHICIIFLFGPRTLSISSCYSHIFSLFNYQCFTRG